MQIKTRRYEWILEFEQYFDQHFLKWPGGGRRPPSLQFYMAGDCAAWNCLPQRPSPPLRDRSAIQYKVYTVLEIRPDLHSHLKPKIASPKWEKESQERKVRGTYCEENREELIIFRKLFLQTWIESVNTYATNFISGFLLQENLFKYESQIISFMSDTGIYVAILNRSNSLED